MKTIKQYLLEQVSCVDCEDKKQEKEIVELLQNDQELWQEFSERVIEKAYVYKDLEIDKSRIYDYMREMLLGFVEHQSTVAPSDKWKKIIAYVKSKVATRKVLANAVKMIAYDLEVLREDCFCSNYYDEICDKKLGREFINQVDYEVKHLLD